MLGDPAPILQWYRNGKVMQGYNGATLNKVATMEDSGGYTLLARNIAGAKISPAVKLVVVDTESVEVPAVAGHTVRIAAPTLATGVTFHWKKDGAEITPSSRITGINARELVITKTESGDAGNYTCTITLGTQSLTGGGCYVVPVQGKPVVVEQLNFGSHTVGLGAVGLFTSFDVEAENYPDTFAIAGMPSGLVLNKTTGTVSGIPRESGTFHLKITATNALGTSEPFYFDLTVEPLAAAMVGTLTGIWSSDDATNDGLGGRCTITMSSTGAFTASLVLGTRSYSTSGLLGTDPWTPSVPQETVIITRSGRVPLYLTVTQEASVGLTATISDQMPGVGYGVVCVCRRSLTRAISVGRYTFTCMDGNSVARVPGLGWFTLGSTGSLSGAIRLLDGQAVTVGTRLTTEFWAPLYTHLYSGTGSLSGILAVDGYGNAAAQTSVSGSLRWLKKPQTKFTRNLMGGFTANLSPIGYGWPEGAMATYARQRYGSLQWVSSTTGFLVSSGTGSLPRIYTEANSVGWKTFSISGSSGFWSGSGTNRYLTDPYGDPSKHIDRNFTALGLMVRDYEGNITCPGHLRMVDLPDDSLGTTLSTSPVSFYDVSFSSSSSSFTSAAGGSSSSGGSYTGGVIISGAVLTTHSY